MTPQEEEKEGNGGQPEMSYPRIGTRKKVKATTHTDTEVQRWHLKPPPFNGGNGELRRWWCGARKLLDDR